MKKDIFDFIRTIIMNGIKPNYSKIARLFNVIQELLSFIFLTRFQTLINLKEKKVITINGRSYRVKDYIKSLE